MYRLKPEPLAALQTTLARGGEIQHQDYISVQKLVADYLDMRAILEPLDALRQVEGCEILLCCDNPDFVVGGGPDAVIEVADEFTGYEFKRFAGQNLPEVLNQALKERTAYHAHQNQTPARDAAGSDPAGSASVQGGQDPPSAGGSTGPVG